MSRVIVVAEMVYLAGCLCVIFLAPGRLAPIGFCVGFAAAAAWLLAGWHTAGYVSAAVVALALMSLAGSQGDGRPDRHGLR